MTAKTIIRGRACAIIRQADRILLNRFGGDSFWALPGGAVELGEFSTDALVREMREELGVTVEIGRLVWMVENLFEYRGTSYTEYGFYYEAAWPLPAHPIVEGEFVGQEPDQFFRWVRNEDIAALDFRPTVLRLPLLAHVSGAKSAAPLHFLHKDTRPRGSGRSPGCSGGRRTPGRSHRLAPRLDAAVEDGADRLFQRRRCAGQGRRADRR